VHAPWVGFASTGAFFGCLLKRGEQLKHGDNIRVGGKICLGNSTRKEDEWCFFEAFFTKILFFI